MNEELIEELVLEAFKQCEKRTYGWQRNEREFRMKFARIIIEQAIVACPHEDGRNHIRKYFDIGEPSIDDTLRNRSTYFGHNP